MTGQVLIGIFLLTAGLVVLCVATLGLFRFREVLHRIHAAALADTLGLFFVLAGLMMLCGFSQHSARLLLALVILWIANPLASHLIAQMELITGWDCELETEEGEHTL